MILTIIISFAAGAVLTRISRERYVAAGQWIVAQYKAWQARRAAAKAGK